MLFIPMAISAVAAGVIWRFVYEFAPKGDTQIGLLNAFLGNFGLAPQAWITDQRIATFSLIVIYVWIWTGFCMVILSAALKGVPDEIIEAAKMDGADAAAFPRTGRCAGPVPENPYVLKPR